MNIPCWRYAPGKLTGSSGQADLLSPRSVTAIVVLGPKDFGMS